jgi:hypothetical protein
VGRPRKGPKTVKTVKTVRTVIGVAARPSGTSRASDPGMYIGRSCLARVEKKEELEK